MKRLNERSCSDYKTVYFDIPSEGGYDRYKAHVWYTWTHEPEIDYKMIDSAIVYELYKNEDIMQFDKGSDIPEQLHDEIVAQLEELI